MFYKSPYFFVFFVLLVIGGVCCKRVVEEEGRNDDWQSSSSGQQSSDSASSEDNPAIQEYLAERWKLVDAENKIKDGAMIHLNSDEIKANQIFTDILQYEELLYSNNDPSAVNIFNELEFISQTQVYNIIQKMPKGSILHVHQDSSATYDYLINVASYLPGCYYYTGETNPATVYGSFRFFASQPSDSSWVLLESLRKVTANVTEFDQLLVQGLTLYGMDDGSYVTLWDKFDAIFGKIAGLVTYTPVTMGYMQHLINQTFADNVQHLEMRKCFGDFYDLTGNTYNDTWFVQQMQQLVENVRVEFNAPEFAIKIIGCDGRHSNKSTVYDHMQFSLELRNQFPQTFIGYDLVGPEDEGYPLLYFIEEFAEIHELGRHMNYPLNYYFHAGETLLYNNTNLYDAILLNSIRIGHGLQLAKHPVLMQLVKENQIGVEVCPISNQVLEYVADFRAHPAFELFNQGVPITINPDDPAIFGYSGVSFDMYEVATAWGLNIAQLKQLALNSLTYSTYYDDKEKDLAFSAWQIKWNQFIQWVNTLTPPNI